jgi:hypothetical protein
MSPGHYSPCYSYTLHESYLLVKLILEGTTATSANTHSPVMNIRQPENHVRGEPKGYFVKVCASEWSQQVWWTPPPASNFDPVGMQPCLKTTSVVVFRFVNETQPLLPQVGVGSVCTSPSVLCAVQLD